MSQEEYDQVYDDFVTKVFGSFNLAQRHELLPSFETALNNLLSPPQPQQQQHKQNTNGTNAIGASGDMEPAKLKKQVEDLEMAIGDRMHQSGYHRSIFQRYDPTHSHSISPQHFQAVCQSQLGIGLYPHELTSFVQKYDTHGNGQINYEDLLKVIEARRSQPRTTAQDASNAALLQRQVPSYDTSAIVASVETPLSQRLEKGLDAMRQTMYMKSSNFHKLFQTLQNDNKKVSITDVLPQMSKLGFPPNLLSEAELEQSLSSAAQTEPGYLSYAEFLSFFMGHKNTASNNVSAGAAQGYQPALVATLVKINNLNLRKVFKALDEDNDGLITTRELSRGLIENGFPAGGASDPSFLEYLHTFSKRQQGTFGYAEFIKFISHRAGGTNATKLDGRPINARPPIILPEDADINRIFDTIVTTRKQQGVAAESVESAWTLIDADDDGKVNEIEFFQGIAELGFQITHAQNQALFAAFDNGDGTVTIAEFAKTLANPHRNTRLSTSVRHAPGGESSINLGTFVSADAGAKEASQRRVSLKQVDTPHRTTHFTSMGVADSDVNEDAKGHGRKQSQEDSNREKISLSFDVAPADPRLPRPASRHNLEGTVDASAPDAKLPTIPEPYQRVRQPPGGASSISFSSDHGAPVVQPQRQSSKLDLLSFDPNAPVQPAQHVLRPPSAGQGRATISLAYVEEQPTTSDRPKTPAGPSTPSNRSSVSFNQTDSESYRPLVQPLRATGGGESSIQLSHPENIPPSPSSYQVRPQDKINVSLSHPENQNEYVPIPSPTRARKSVDGAPTSTLKLSHDSSRNDEDLVYAAPQHKTRQHVESPTKSTLQLGMDTPDVSQYKNDVGTGDIDTNLLATITKAIYAHSQRLRHTFQEFNHSQSSTLSKANFKNGITNILKISIPDNQVDILYSRFDGDLDGEITYSEFVRMLATK